MGTYDTTLGTLLVGIFLNTYLYGLVTYQFAAYYRTKFNDRPALKCMIFFLFILDTFHSIAAIYMAWYYTVANYDNPAVLGLGLWPYQFTPIGTALAACVTQTYLGYRIWCLTNNKLLYTVVMVLAIPSFALGAACGIEAATISVLSELPRITPLVIAWLSTQVVVDMFITTTLIIIFARWRGGFRKTDRILNRLIRGAIQTGVFAGIFSIGDLITFSIIPNTNLYGMFAIPIGRIYTNTLMDTLLTRELIREEWGVARYAHSAVRRSASPALGRRLFILEKLDSVGWAPPETSQVTSTGWSESTQVHIKRTTPDTDNPSATAHRIDVHSAA